MEPRPPLKTGAPAELPGVPALVFCDEQTSRLKIAALTLLDRLVVTLHRAGAVSITLVARDKPAGLKRTNALGIPVRFLPVPPVPESATLVARANLLVQVADVRGLLQNGGRLATGDGEPLAIGVLPPGDAPWESALDRLPLRPVTGVGLCVTDPATARQAERALWASLTSSTDGFVDVVFNRPCGRPLSKALIHTPISPNAVSLASIAIGLAAAWFFADGSHWAILLAAILFQVSAIVDCVDGDLARALFKESPLGKWLDLVGDQVVHLAVFAAIAVGVAHDDGSLLGLWLGLSAVLGAVISFAVVVRRMCRPANDCRRRLQKLIDAVTNRDFSVLVLVLACLNRLEWFLWLSAIGCHLFWLTALWLQYGTHAARHDQNLKDALPGNGQRRSAVKANGSQGEAAFSEITALPETFPTRSSPHGKNPSRTSGVTIAVPRSERAEGNGDGAEIPLPREDADKS